MLNIVTLDNRYPLGHFLPYVLPIFSGLTFKSLSYFENLNLARKVFKILIYLVVIFVLFQFDPFKSFYQKIENIICGVNICDPVDEIKTKYKFWGGTGSFLVGLWVCNKFFK